jgi:hypothetical protein
VRLRLRRREVLLLGLLAVAAVVALWPQLSGSGAAPAVLSRSSRPAPPLPPVPRIDLARLEEKLSEVEVGRRDLFAYGPLNAGGYEPPPEAPAPVPRTTPPPTAGGSGGRAGAGRAGLPPLNLKFIGSVGNAQGVKVAVLLTESNEVLTGQRGEVVANRYRIARIGIESVDLEDVGTGQSRRIPLKGN